MLKSNLYFFSFFNFYLFIRENNFVPKVHFFKTNFYNQVNCSAATKTNLLSSSRLFETENQAQSEIIKKLSSRQKKYVSLYLSVIVPSCFTSPISQLWADIYIILSTPSLVFPSFQGGPTIFHKEIFLKQTPHSKS